MDTVEIERRVESICHREIKPLLNSILGLSEEQSLIFIEKMGDYYGFDNATRDLNKLNPQLIHRWLLYFSYKFGIIEEPEERKVMIAITNTSDTVKGKRNGF